MRGHGGSRGESNRETKCRSIEPGKCRCDLSWLLLCAWEKRSGNECARWQADRSCGANRVSEQDEPDNETRRPPTPINQHTSTTKTVESNQVKTSTSLVAFVAFVASFLFASGRGIESVSPGWVSRRSAGTHDTRRSLHGPRWSHKASRCRRWQTDGRRGRRRP